jgi:DNA modification methylase
MIDVNLNTNLHKIEIGTSTLFWADCFDVFPSISDKSVDAIIADLPYGTTAC